MYWLCKVFVKFCECVDNFRNVYVVLCEVRVSLRLGKLCLIWLLLNLLVVYSFFYIVLMVFFYLLCVICVSVCIFYC